MSKDLNEPKGLHERGARGAKPPKPVRRSGISHVSPGRHEAPISAAEVTQTSKRAVRPATREILRKERH